VNGEDFSGITADLDLRAVSAGAGTNPTLPTLAADQVLTLSAYLADERSVAGAGTGVVLGDMTEVTASLSSIATDLDISDAEGTPTSLPTLVSGQELRVTAAQMTDVAAAGVPIGGSGDVTVELPNIQTPARDFSSIRATGTVKVEFGSDGGVDGAYSLNAGTDMTGVDEVVLAGTTTLTQAQANNVSFSGPGAVVINFAADGAQALKGSAQNDTIFADSDETTIDTVDISQGGNDILGFGAKNSFIVTGFSASGDDYDSINFRSVSASLENVNARGGTPTVQQFDGTATSITGEVVLFSGDVQTSSASGIATLFNFAAQSGQTTINGLLGDGSGNKMLFFIANDDNSAVNVWRWDDASGANQGAVQETELSLLATFNGMTRQDLNSLDPNNQFIL
jgi:hypothetical protein